MGKEYGNIFKPFRLRTGDALKNRIIYPNARHTLMQSQSGLHGVHQQRELILPELGYGSVTSAWANEVTTTKIIPKTVTCVDQDGNEATIGADTVSGGCESHTAQALRHADCTKQFCLAGGRGRRNNGLRRGSFSACGKAMLL